MDVDQTILMNIFIIAFIGIVISILNTFIKTIGYEIIKTTKGEITTIEVQEVKKVILTTIRLRKRNSQLDKSLNPTYEFGTIENAEAFIKQELAPTIIEIIKYP